jgi:hypothetical protein
MQLTEHDLGLLELAAVQVPWQMVCGEFHERFGSPGALALRLFEMRDAGLLIIRTAGAESRIAADVLEADALANGCYEDFGWSGEPRWELVATEQGYEQVRDRLAAQ